MEKNELPTGNFPDRTIFFDRDGGIWVRHDGDWMRLRKYLQQRDDERWVCVECGMDLFIIEGQYLKCHDCGQWYQFYNPHAPVPIYGEPSPDGWEGDKT